MSVIRVFVPNSFQNYNHLAFCPNTGVAAAIDPFDAELLVDLSKRHQLTIKHIWLTHEHGDHIRQLSELKALTDAKVFAPKTCQQHFEADVWLEHEQTIELGTLTVQHWLTPGHTPGHGIYVCQNVHRPWAVFGDTVFNAGVGNVRSGNVEELYESIQMLKQRLPANTDVYTGHDYLTTNLNFTLANDPQNIAAASLLERATQQQPDSRTVTTWALETQINLFLQAPSLTVFRALRLKRDQW